MIEQICGKNIRGGVSSGHEAERYSCSICRKLRKQRSKGEEEEGGRSGPLKCT